MKIKFFLLLITIGSIFLFFSCTKEKDPELNQDKLNSLKLQYDLQETNHKKEYVRFLNVIDAENYLNDINKKTKPQRFYLKQNSKGRFYTSKNGSNKFDLKSDNEDGIYILRGDDDWAEEEDPWSSQIKAGLFSSFRLDFNTTGEGINRNLIKKVLIYRQQD